MNTTNNITDVSPNFSYETVVLQVGYAAICFLNCFLSILVTLAIIYRPALQTASGWTIVHHQFLQILLSGIIPIFDFLAIYPNDSIHCAEANFFAVTVVYAESWASFFLSLNRFVALIIPHKYSTFSTRRVFFITVGLSWTLGIVSRLPVYLGVGAIYGNTKAKTCGYLKVDNFPLLTLFTTLGGYLPLALQGAVHLAISVRLLALKQRKRVHPEAAPVFSLNHRVTLFRCLFCAYLWYLVCFVPAPSLSIMLAQRGYGSVVRTLLPRLIMTFGYTGSPVFLLTFSREFRMGVESLFGGAYRRLLVAGSSMRHSVSRQLFPLDHLDTPPFRDRGHSAFNRP